MVGFILLHGVLPVFVFALAFLIEKKYAKASLQENMSQLWTQASLLKTLYISFAVVIGFALLVLFVNLYSVIISLEWGGKPRADETLAPINVQNLALAFIGTVSGLGALFGVYLAIRRTEESKRQSDASEREATTAEQGLITDQLNKATEGLGKSNQKDKPVIAVRLGAIYALERIAQDSIRDHVPVMEILCAYVRNNSPRTSKTTKKGNPLREDIQTALTIIGRRGVWTGGQKSLAKEAENRYRIDLQECDLRGAILSRANLRGARFLGSNMNHATFDNADLSNTWFEDAILNGAWFGNAKMNRAWAWEGDFSKCRELTQKQLDVMYCGIDVKIPGGLTRPNHWPTGKLPFDKFQDGYFEWETAQPDSYLKPQDTKAPTNH